MTNLAHQILVAPEDPVFQHLAVLSDPQDPWHPSDQVDLGILALHSFQEYLRHQDFRLVQDYQALQENLWGLLDLLVLLVQHHQVDLADLKSN